MIPPSVIYAIALCVRLHPAYRVITEVRPLAAAVMIVSTFAVEALANEEIERIEAFRHALGDDS